MVIHLVNESFDFMEPGVSLPCSKKTVTGPHPEPTEIKITVLWYVVTHGWSEEPAAYQKNMRYNILNQVHYIYWKLRRVIICTIYLICR